MTFGSDAPFFIEMVLLSGGQSIDLPATEYFQSLSIEEISVGAWTGQLVLFDSAGDFLENLVISAGLDRGIRIRFGRRGSSGPEDTHEYFGAITTLNPTFEPHGITLTFDIVSEPALIPQVDKKVRSFESGLKISEMVRRIAEDRQWDHVIEETQGTMTEPFSSKGETDMKFMRDQLLPQAVSQGTGEGDYVCRFDRDNVFRFHTPDFGNPEVHHFTYARTTSGDVVSFAPQDTTLFGKLMGGGNTKFGGVGSQQGQGTQIGSSQTDGVDGTGGSPVQSDSDAKRDYGSGTHAYWDSATRDRDELARMAQVRFDKFRKQEYRASLQIHGTNRVKLEHYVEVDYIKSDGTLHYLSGRFQVFTSKHTLDSSGWQTEFDVMRFGIKDQAGTEVVSSTQTNTPQTASGGSGVNIPVDNV